MPARPHQQALLKRGRCLRLACRQQAPQLQVYKAFIDGGWFLDIAPYASRQDGFTFQKAARVLAGPLQAAFDRYNLPPVKRKTLPSGYVHIGARLPHLLEQAQLEALDMPSIAHILALV